MYTPVITNGSTRFGNNRWHSYSPKLKRNVFLFSDLEYEHGLLIESNPNIAEFCEQPLEVSSLVNGKVRSSIFDMWIKYTYGRQEFRAIKYTSELHKNQVNEQIAVQKDWCNQNGYNHVVITEKIIRKNKLLLSNIKLILKLVKQFVPSEIDKFKVKKILNENPQKKLSLEFLLQNSHLSQNVLISLIGWMIFKGELNSDIPQNHFGINTEVWING